MRHGLLRLGLDIEISLKSDASAIFHSHAHKRSYVFLLKLNIGVQQSFVALSSTPEHIASAAELNGNIKRLFYLRRSKAINIDIVGAAGAVHKPRIAEHICRSPKAPDIRAVHFFKNIVRNFIKTRVCNIYVLILGNQIDIVEAEVFNTELLHKFEAGIHLCPCVLHHTGYRSERFISRTDAEHIRACRAQIVPPCHGERQVLAHLFAKNHSVGIIELESKRI